MKKKTEVRLNSEEEMKLRDRDERRGRRRRLVTVGRAAGARRWGVKNEEAEGGTKKVGVWKYIRVLGHFTQLSFFPYLFTSPIFNFLSQNKL